MNSASHTRHLLSSRSATHGDMELDRSKVNVSVAVDTELEVVKQEKVRKPRKRFIGQRAAAERAEGKGDSSVAIEDNGAIQGARGNIP